MDAVEPDRRAGAGVPDNTGERIGDSDGDWNPDACDADFDNDGAVGQSDWRLLARCIAHPEAGSCEDVDVNGDWALGIAEFQLLGSEFGGPVCP